MACESKPTLDPKHNSSSNVPRAIVRRTDQGLHRQPALRARFAGASVELANAADKRARGDWRHIVPPVPMTRSKRPPPNLHRRLPKRAIESQPPSSKAAVASAAKTKVHFGSGGGQARFRSSCSGVAEHVSITTGVGCQHPVKQIVDR